MAEKNIKSRVVLKHDISSNWQLATGFTPLKGEVVIYDPDESCSYSRVKVGDGVHNINSLPFIDANKVDKVAGKGLSTNDYTTTEKNKLAGIAEGANKTVVDSTLSSTSTNPVQNKAIYNKLEELTDMTPVSEQIATALNNATADDFGIYVQATEPSNAVAGDIWVDTASDPSYIPPTIPAITAADNGKVLMVVNGTLQLVNLNLSIDANGVVSM